MSDHPDLPIPSVPYASIDYEYASRLVTVGPDDDGPVWMVNLMAYKERATYADGRPSHLSGMEADDRYAPFESLAAVGAELVFVADVEAQLLGASPAWDRVAVVRYPTRRSFMDMQARPDFQAKHVHKEAGMRETIVMAGLPLDVPSLPADAPGWADVPHPSTAADGPVVVLHVIRYADDRGGGDDMAAYQQEAGRVAVPHGVRLAGWFRVEGTILGDGRSWDQARFNAFPSRAAFEAVVVDPERLEAQADHRDVAIADTYTLILRPFIDRLHESVTGAASPT
jgi:hypothetical protein